MHRLALDGFDLHGDQAVVEQQHVASLHIARQFLVVQTHGSGVTRLGARGVEDEFLAGFQHHLAFGELADADFRALQVGHDGHFAAGALSGFAHQASAVDVVLCLAVAEVQAHHIDPGKDHLFKQGRITGCGAEGGNNLGRTTRHLSVSL